MAEGGAGGKEVGRISVRVVPNTDRFRADLQRQLDTIEDETRFKVRIDPAMDGFRDKVEAATRGLKDAKVKVKAEFDRHGDLIHDLDNLIDEAGDRAKLDVTPNIKQDSFQKALRDVKTQAKLSNVKVDVDFTDKEAESRLQALIYRLKAIAKAEDIKVRVTTEHGPRSGFRGAWDRGGESAAGGGSNFGGGVAGAGLKILGDQTLFIVVAVVALLAPALALLSTALVSLPALITAVALPLGVFALGMTGIKKALDDSGFLTLFQKTGKKGQAEGDPKQKVGQVIKDIQKPINDIFEKGLTPVFKQIAGAIPQLVSGLPQVAQGIVNLAQGVTSAITSAGNIKNLQGIMGNVSQMLTNLGPGLGTFANSIVTLASKVSTHLPGLATYFDNFATRFGNWVDKVSKPGPDFWGEATPSILDKAVTGLKPTLDAILDFVGQLLNAGLQMAANPDMGKNIQTFISGIKDFVTNSLPDLMAFFNSMSGLIKTLGLGHDQQPKDSDLNGSKPGATPQNPHGFTKDGVPASSNGKELDTGKFTPDLNGVKALLGLSKGGWWDRITKGGLTRPHTDHPVIVEQGGGQPQQGPPPVPQASLAPLFPGVPGGKDLAGQVNQATSQVKPAIAAMADGSDKVWDKLVEATKAAGNTILATVQSWVGQIQSALAGLGPAGLAAGQALGTGMAAGIAAGAPSAIAAATALAQGVENAAKTHLGIHSPSKVFQDLGQNTAQGFQDGLEGGFQGVIDSAHSLAQQVADAVAGHNLGGGAGKQLGAQVKDQLQAIKVEQDQLRAQSAGTADKGQKKAIQGQIDQLGIAKDQLKAQSSQLGYSEKYGDSQANSTKQQEAQLDLQQQQLKAQYDATTDKGKRRELQVEMDKLKAQKDALKLQGGDKSGSDKTDKITQGLGQSVNKMVDIGKNFAMANVNQFENDIGISGKGAIPTIANIGLDWATSTLGNMASGLLGGGKGKGDTHIHVNSIDEGLAAKQTLENRQALTNNAGR